MAGNSPPATVWFGEVGGGGFSGDAVTWGVGVAKVSWTTFCARSKFVIVTEAVNLERINTLPLGVMAPDQTPR